MHYYFELVLANQFSIHIYHFIGGINVDGKTKEESLNKYCGYRLKMDPLVLDLTNCTITRILVREEISFFISATLVIPYTNRKFLCFGGYTSPKVSSLRTANNPTNKVHYIQFNQDLTEVVQIDSKQLNCIGFASAYGFFCTKAKKTIFLSMGTFSAYCLFTKVTMKTDRCDLPTCKLLQPGKEEVLCRANEWIKCDGCRHWIHAVCNNITTQKYQYYVTSNESIKLHCRLRDCKKI